MKRPVMLSETERQYKDFDKWSKIVIGPLALPVPVLSCLLIFAKDDVIEVCSALLLMIWTAVIIISCVLIGKKRTTLEEKLWEERNAVKRVGILKELYEEFHHDGFEFKISSDKFLFDDCHRNAMECAFLKHGHEFAMMIDENAVSILVDEETSHPAEQEIPLSEIASVDAFYHMINHFVSEYSET